MIGAGAVEYYYSALSPRIFGAYTQLYPITEYQAETYRIHGPMDREHAERALSKSARRAVHTSQLDLDLKRHRRCFSSQQA